MYDRTLLLVKSAPCISNNAAEEGSRQPLLQRSAEHMSCPIFDVDDQLCLNIQLMSRKQKNAKYFASFTNLDEILF